MIDKKIRTYVYFIDTEVVQSNDNRNTKCDITAVLNIKKLSCYDMLMKIDPVKKFIESIIDDNGMIPLHAIGKSVCDERDTPDVSVGKNLAVSKAQYSIFKQATIIYAEILRTIHENFYIELVNCSDRTYNAWCKSSNHIYDLFEEVGAIDSSDADMCDVITDEEEGTNE
ncbi:MAG: hypothetical protein J6D03_00925 [Clostridia bacterium]|nr:hypothetical protein [Clostridia bacterium]